MVRALALLTLLLATAVAVPAVADAARRSGVDREARIRLTLDGRELTVNDYAPPGAGSLSFDGDDEMWQRPERLHAICGTTFRPLRRSQHDRNVLMSGDWPRDARHATFRFRRDLSARARWCLIEGLDGGDVAFVSFLRGEPRRRVASGHGADGRAWTLAAWRSERLAPCLRLRARGDWQERCFDDQAEGPARLDAEFWNGACRGGLVYGVAPLGTAAIALTYAGGRREQIAALAPADGSRLRARLFASELTGGDRVVAISALDAAGRALQTLRASALRCA